MIDFQQNSGISCDCNIRVKVAWSTTLIFVTKAFLGVNPGLWVWFDSKIFRFLIMSMYKRWFGFKFLELIDTHFSVWSVLLWTIWFLERNYEFIPEYLFPNFHLNLNVEIPPAAHKVGRIFLHHQPRYRHIGLYV